MVDNDKVLGLLKIQEGVAILLKSMGTGADVPAEVPAQVTPTTAVSASDTDEGEYGSVSYNDLKKLAKERGVSAVGNRKDIIARLAEQDSAPKAPAKSEKVIAMPSRKPTSKPAPEESEEVEEADEADEPVDDIEAKVNEAVADLSDEEIADFLSENKIRAKGNRQAMISKLVEAVREGKIELADDEETEDTEETEEESEESESEYSDNTNDTDTNENIPEARKKAIIKARKAFEKKQPTSKEMLKYLVEYYGKDNEADIKALGAEELADLYLDTKLCFIDDEGKEHESAEGAPYPRNGEFACCGAVLQYDEEKSQYVCTVCGEVYEAE